MNENILIKYFRCGIPLSLIFLICKMVTITLRFVAGLEGDCVRPAQCLACHISLFLRHFFSPFNISKIDLHLMIDGIQFIFSVFFLLIQKIMVHLNISGVLDSTKHSSRCSIYELP